LFASMDASHDDVPPVGWRRAWIAQRNETRIVPARRYRTLTGPDGYERVLTDVRHHYSVLGEPDTHAYVCPEETGTKPNCLACGYCFAGQKHDVVFLEH